MPTLTTHYSWIKPDVGLSANVWGGNLNQNFDSIDTQVFANTQGTTTNDNAPPGAIGEVISSVVTVAVPLVNATPVNVASIPLTPGDWDVTGEVWITAPASSVTGLQAAINSVSATIPFTNSINTSRNVMPISFPGAMPILPLRLCRIAVPAGTPVLPVYLIAFATFTAAAPTAIGNIWARRPR